jgi:hypothetical protein
LIFWLSLGTYCCIAGALLCVGAGFYQRGITALEREVFDEGIRS